MLYTVSCREAIKTQPVWNCGAACFSKNFMHVIFIRKCLTDVLMYHIVPGAHFSEGLRDGTWLTTLAQEQELLLRVTSDGYSRK